MAKQRTKVAPGDVLSVEVGNQWAYLHYLGKHEMYGDAVLVAAKLYDREVTVTAEMFSGGYVTFYPVGAAIAQKLVSVVGHVPPTPPPTRFRRRGAMVGGQVRTWIIEDSSGDTVKADLSAEDLHLPIASIWNHQFLVQRLSEGWHPVQEGRARNDSRQAVTEDAAMADVKVPNSISHYVYLPSREAAVFVGKVLRDRGFTTEERLGADGVNWLVLARHVAVPSEAAMESIRQSMEALVVNVGGEYDGWEVDVTRHTPVTR